MKLEHRQIYKAWDNQKQSQKTLSQCSFIHYKFRVPCPGKEPRTFRWEAGVQLPEVWYGKCSNYFKSKWQGEKCNFIYTTHFYMWAGIA